MAKVSVVVCTKNEEKYIEACLKALKSQSVKPEIIVVDGNSKDKTKDIAKKFADKIIVNDKIEIDDARNIGWKNATGDIIAYCDADSIPEKDWVKNILDVFEKTNAFGISGPFNSYDGSFLLKWTIKFWADWFPSFLAFLFNYHSCWGMNMAFRKKTFEKFKFREKFLEDFDIGSQLRAVKKMKFVRKLNMIASSRRFKTTLGFYKICLKYYILYTLISKLTGKKGRGYFQ